MKGLFIFHSSVKKAFEESVVFARVLVAERNRRFRLFRDIFYQGPGVNKLHNLAVLVLALFISLGISAQVQVTMNVPMLGSPYLADYIGLENNPILVLSNQSAQPQQVYLRGSISQLSPPGYYLRTKTNFKPAFPIVLAPFETRTLFANEQDFAFITQKNLEDNIPQRIRNEMLASGLLPEGDYQLCVQAFDFQTDIAVSNEAPAGCQYFFVTRGTPPQIVFPVCNDTVFTTYPTISWSPAISFIPLSLVLYDLYVLPYTFSRLNPNQLMEQAINFNAGNPIVKYNLSGTSYMFTPADLPLQAGKTYLVAVVAKVNNSSSMFENNGRSEICMFYIKAPSVKDPFVVVGPVTSGITIIKDPLTFQATTTSISGKLHHRFRNPQYGSASVELMGAVSGSGKGAGATDGFVEMSKIMQEFDLSNMLNSPTTNSIGGSSGSTSGSGAGLAGAASAFQRDASLGSIANENLSIDYTYNQNVNISPPVFFDVNYIFSSNPYSGGSRPLRNVNISLIEQYVLVSSSSGSNIEDYIILDEFSNPVNFTVPVSFQPKIVQTVKTDEHGNYNFNVILHRPGEVVATLNDIPAGWGMVYGPIYEGVTSPSVLNVAKGGKYLTGRYVIRVYRLIVEDNRYYSPDIMLLPKPGNNIQVPLQTSLIRSYKLEVEVKSAGGLASGDAAPNIQARVIRKLGDRQNMQPAHPDFEPVVPDDIPQNTVILQHYGLSDHTGLGVSYYKMHMDNQNKLKVRNLVAHRDNNQSMYYLLLETPHYSAYNYGPVAIPIYTGRLAFHGGGFTTDSPVCIPCFNSAYKDRHFNHQFIEPTVSTIETLYPNQPEIYLQVFERNLIGEGGQSTSPRDKRNSVFGAVAPLPNVRVNITAANNQHIEAFTDINGKFRRTLHVPPGQAGVSTIIFLSKSGYKTEYRGPHIIQMGERYPAGHVYMDPLGRVKLEVTDEFNVPTKSDVQFGEGLIVRTRDECELVFGSPGSSSFGSGSLGPQSSSGVSSGGLVSNFNQVPSAKTVTLSSLDQSSINIEHFQYIGNTGQSTTQSARGGFSGSTTPFGLGEVTKGNSFVEGLVDLTQNQSFCRQMITMKAPSGQTPLAIDPMATKYEELKTTVNIPVSQSGAITDLGVFKVNYKRRKAYIRVLCGPTLIISNQNFGQIGNYYDAENVVQCPDLETTIKLHHFQKTFTGLPGSHYFEFMSPGNTFRLTIDAGEDYVLIDTFIELSYQVDSFLFVLDPGKSKFGTVTDAETGLPLEGARVFVINGQNSIETVYHETFTDAEGKYHLKGIKDFGPPESKNNNRFIYVAKSDGTITYIGQQKPLSLQNTINPVNFQLVPLSDWDISRLLGFEIDLLDVKPSGHDRMEISGMLTYIPSNAHFAPERPQKVRIPFKNVLVGKHSEPEPDGRFIAVPISNSFILDARALRIVINQNFIGTLLGSITHGNVQQAGQIESLSEIIDPYSTIETLAHSTISGTSFAHFMSNANKIRIFKDTERTGSIWGLTDVKLESFNFANDFDARFYLGHTPEDARVRAFQSTAQSKSGSGQVSNNVDQISKSPGSGALQLEGQSSNVVEFTSIFDMAAGYLSELAIYQNVPNISEAVLGKDSFFVGTLGTGHKLVHPTYRVEAFPAFARTDMSTLKGNTFSLSSWVSISVPDMNPASIIVPIGEVIIMPNSVNIQYGEGELKFKLDQWEVNAPSWIFDQTTSSIKLNNTKVKTKFLTFNLGTLYLQPNKPPISIAELNFEQHAQPMLANVTPLRVYPGGNIQLAYDQPLHIHESSNKKLYRITIANPDNHACYITLPGHVDGDTLNFEYFHIYSDGKDHVHMANPEQVGFYNVLPLKEVGIEGGADFFDLRGTPALNLPAGGQVDNYTTILRFFRDGNQIKREIVSNAFSIKNIQGHLNFIGDDANNQTRILGNNNYVVYGNLEVMNDNVKRIVLRARLTYRDHGQYVNIETFDVNEQGMSGTTKQRILLDNAIPTNYLDVLEGGIAVASGTWESLKFLSAFEGEDASAGFKPGENQLWFSTVSNAIDAMEGQKVGVKDMDISVSDDQSDIMVFSVDFDFATKALRGSWEIRISKTPGITVGNVTIYGDLRGGFKYSPVGFYFYQTVEEVVIQPAPFPISIFFVVGSSPYSNFDDSHKQILFAGSGGSVFKRLSDFPGVIQQNGFGGLFAGGNVTLLDFSFELDLVLLGLGFNIDIGTDMYTYFNFGNGSADLGFGMLAYYGIELHAWLLFCSACLIGEAQVGLCGNISTTNSFIAGMASITLGTGLCGIKFSESIKLLIELTYNIQTNDGDFKVMFGGGTENSNNGRDCLPTNNPIEKGTCGT